MPSLTDDDLEFVDEVATRLGAALNTAVLFERQSRGRAALETLQQVSGRIASVATVDQVVRSTPRSPTAREASEPTRARCC